ncbi:UDP-diphospho-muramoylpentapeptide beta-N- acetylglucosaminyltransferase [Lysinibacillus sp. BF-4]|uniref:undecaprenyldiphospho-muramoylpentapeptide beta-N-acetylglucosaminyltransferase n=1 Tax=Lysinibacillus sp. BF-4 TaxID=1473546 RepID=UPI0005071DC3|nr:undecaprenyldiphospho-muramoylpentapeptide beta-N-acetylglucosaminyltransferase [Lysinibacillus sp. BF-4]KFL43338.1 UDP-diphospho-muramoylpentapeptide beta-N- acetylglucosaminyltransferase [Lysinibacillus sp. BF-4]
MKDKTIILTGGGTAGHVSLNQAIIPSLLEKGYDVHYIGSTEGIEQEIIGEAFPKVPFYGIASGKLRRYFSFKNFTDPFRVMRGVMQAFRIIRRVKPSVVFSKGGFVSVPVVIAAKLANVPIVIHESDVTPGLANKIALPFASHVFTVFEETLKHLPSDRATCTGSIIRSSLFTGDREKGIERCEFAGDKEILLLMGGSQGSKLLNDIVRENLDRLLARFDIIHLCGKGNVDVTLYNTPGYKQFEYVTDELSDLLHASDYIVSRAGSNAIFEFLTLHKPMLLIPLSARQSRGDQVLNANLFKRQAFAEVLEEEKLTTESFFDALKTLIDKAPQYIERMADTQTPKTPEEMVELIIQYEK